MKPYPFDTTSDMPAQQIGSSRPAHGWALEIEIDTHFDSRDGIAAQLEEIARQIRRGTTEARGNGSGGSHAWKLTSKAPNDEAQVRREPCADETADK